MNGPSGYFGAATAMVGLVTLGLWPVVGGTHALGLLEAGALALLTQGALLVGLARWRRNPARFAHSLFVAWIARMTLIFAATLLLVWPGYVPVASFLLGLGGFLFGMVVLESLFLKLSVYEAARVAAES